MKISRWAKVLVISLVDLLLTLSLLSSLQLALAHHQSSQDESVASLTRQLSEARSEASGHKDHALRLEADCSRLQADIEEKDRAIKSLEDQVEDLGKSLSKINAQYQRQFARIEADQSSVIESVKGEARAQVEAAKQEAQAQVAAIKSEAQAQLGTSPLKLSFIAAPSLLTLCYFHPLLLFQLLRRLSPQLRLTP